MARLLITGSSGFVGTHLLDAMAAGGMPGYEPQTIDGIDIGDEAALTAQLRDAVPDAVIHLAAQSNVPQAFADPRGTIETNLLGTLALLRALQAVGFRGRFLFVSSGDVYGVVPEAALPVDESRAPAPRNPYAVSKVAAEALCRQWHATEGLDLLIARPFNHIGPAQGEAFVVPSLAKQVAYIALGRGEPVVDAGDLETSRDFTDVRDVVAAYFALLARGKAGETYNVSSGREVVVRTLFDRLCELADVTPKLRIDGARLRRAEQRRMVASSDKLRADTGWQPVIPLDRTLADILEYWTERLEQ